MPSRVSVEAHVHRLVGFTRGPYRDARAATDWLPVYRIVREKGVSKDLLGLMREAGIGPPWVRSGRQFLYDVKAFDAFLAGVREEDFVGDFLRARCEFAPAGFERPPYCVDSGKLIQAATEWLQSVHGLGLPNFRRELYREIRARGCTFELENLGPPMQRLPSERRRVVLGVRLKRQTGAEAV